MKKIALIFLILMTFMSQKNEASEKALKTLILIIATDDKPAYRELQKIWESYMNRDPKHFEAYFIRANPNLATPYVISKNEIIVKTEEGFVPGILNKSILSIEAMQSRLNEFDYVIRTNLSSFYPFENLLNYLKKLPRENCYCGISLFEIKEYGIPPKPERFPFVSGAGIILSTDMAKLLINEHSEFDMYKEKMPDDVFLGLFYYKKNIPIISAQRWDYPTYASWTANNHAIENYAYHFRAKYSYNIRTSEDPYKDELLTLKDLVQKYYP